MPGGVLLLLWSHPAASCAVPEWAQQRQSKEKAEKTLQAIYAKWKTFREKIILPSAKTPSSSSSSSSYVDSPLASLDKQVANFFQVPLASSFFVVLFNARRRCHLL
jgi:hypothetical protein